MKMKKAFWACSLVLPATIVPLSTASCACSQSWGSKTPISIGTNIKGGDLDPYKNFTTGYTSLVDLNGEEIVPQLQSNYAIDVAHSNYYGYSLPEKWNKEKENGTTKYGDAQVVWEKGGFEIGSAGWRDYSSSDFDKSETLKGEWSKPGSENKTISDTRYSYRNNTLASNIELVSLIGTSINQFLNYALQYQGSQIGTGYSESEADTDLGICWGAIKDKTTTTFTHGSFEPTSPEESDTNRKYFESVFASNNVSTTGKANANLRPTHVEFTFKDFPIVSYAADDSKNITGVNEATLTLLNGEAVRPSAASKQYYASVSDEYEEQQFRFTDGGEDKLKFRTYTFNNVPVVVSLTSFAKSYVNPTSGSGYLVSDFYSESKAITDTVGSSWSDSLPKFTKTTKITPMFRSFIYSTQDEHKVIEPLYETAASVKKVDGRISNLEQNDFVVLLNYAYKECTKVNDTTPADIAKYDRVTMTGLSTIMPAYMCDNTLGIPDEKTFFTIANELSGGVKGYTFDNSKVNKYNNLLLEVYKRTSGQGQVPHAKNLNDTSKALLRFLSYMFGDKELNVDTSKFLTTVSI